MDNDVLKNLGLKTGNLEELKEKLELLYDMNVESLISDEEYKDLKEAIISAFKKSLA